MQMASEKWPANDTSHGWMPGSAPVSAHMAVKCMLTLAMCGGSFAALREGVHG